MKIFFYFGQRRTLELCSLIARLCEDSGAYIFRIQSQIEINATALLLLNALIRVFFCVFVSAYAFASRTHSCNLTTFVFI